MSVELSPAASSCCTSNESDALYGNACFKTLLYAFYFGLLKARIPMI
jgi:hypothetical protein